MKHDLSTLNDVIGEPPEVFVCPVSYEDRCLTIAERIDTSRLRTSILLSNSDYRASVAANVERLSSYFENLAQNVELRADDPLFTADKLRSLVIPEIQKAEGVCLVDITSFTHEHLLILIRFLTQFVSNKKVKIVYSGADEYSTNHTGGDKWLSKGLASIRTVLGYPGLLFPSKQLHLVILVGFEAERAELLIFNTEPSRLTLGLGRRGQSVTESLYETNVVFHKRVEAFVKETLQTVAPVDQFEFSCVDPIQTMNDILDLQESSSSDYNMVLCPLNTKPSTLGAALAATKSDQIQIIYAQPVEYNVGGYSRPGRTFTLYDFAELLTRANIEKLFPEGQQ
jgi:hypothetical protein